MKKKTLKGFTLVEIVIVLIIAGIIVGGVLKGRDAMESAKIVAAIDEIKKLQAAIISYQSDYGRLPGDDEQAKANFGGVIENGTGDGAVESAKAWVHLNAAGLLHDSKDPTSGIGGRYTLVNKPFDDNLGNFLMLSSDGKGKAIMTPKQAQKLKSKARDGGGLLIIRDGKGTTKNDCISDDGQLKLENKSASCVLLVPIS